MGLWILDLGWTVSKILRVTIHPNPLHNFPNFGIFLGPRAWLRLATRYSIVRGLEKMSFRSVENKIEQRNTKNYRALEN